MNCAIHPPLWRLFATETTRREAAGGCPQAVALSTAPVVVVVVDRGGVRPVCCGLDGASAKPPVAAAGLSLARGAVRARREILRACDRLLEAAHTEEHVRHL